MRPHARLSSGTPCFLLVNAAIRNKNTLNRQHPISFIRVLVFLEEVKVVDCGGLDKVNDTKHPLWVGDTSQGNSPTKTGGGSSHTTDVRGFLS